MHAVDDEPFDVDAVQAGAWAPSPYGPGDKLGTYNEVTPAKRAAAIAMLDPNRAICTFSLGATLDEEFPGFGGRTYQQSFVVSGFETTGAEVLRARPRGQNRLSALEERVQFTYNMGAKINGLHHCGVGSTGYDGCDLAALVEAGARAYDTTTWGPPLLTRGLLVDVLALKLEQGESGALSTTMDGRPLLHDDYRVTVEDYEAAIARQGLPAFEPGDVILLHTGWQRLVRSDPDRYLKSNPGPWLRESRWLAQFRPAVIGGDTWCWETVDPGVNGRLASPCHQELSMKFGIRLGEGLRLDDLVDAGVDRFVFCHAPLPATGAVSSNAPPLAIANEPA
ncbi:MAG TPA: cyclase family protein [Acidimicrobiales bacterium]|jgi:kynurenine formamidase|nr:cyclase family protein [Acidimicrobiales bacterium]